MSAVCRTRTAESWRIVTTDTRRPFVLHRMETEKRLPNATSIRADAPLFDIASTPAHIRLARSIQFKY